MSNIDFSQVDLIVGVVIGAAGMATAGFIIWRAKMVRLWGENTEQPTGTLSELKEMIKALQTDLKQYVKEHQDCQKTLAKEYVSWDVLNTRILDPITRDRERRWNEYDRHRHDQASGILIKP